jgi:hypothetical protein
MDVICVRCGVAVEVMNGPEQTSDGVCVPCVRRLMRRCPTAGALPQEFRRCADSCPIASRCERLARVLRKSA